MKLSEDKVELLEIAGNFRCRDTVPVPLPVMPERGTGAFLGLLAAVLHTAAPDGAGRLQLA